MNTLSIFLLVLALILACSIVYYQYFFKQKITTDTRLLALLRFVSVLAVLILLINPKFEQKISEIIKPKLLLGFDNSASIVHSKSSNSLLSIRSLFLNDPELNDRFDVSGFLFGTGLSTDSLLDFQDQQTNIYRAVRDLDILPQKKESAILLLTDGRQTFGKNYAYMASNNAIYPIVIGDTISKSDIAIDRVNVNAYATLENKFPVEVFMSSSSDENLESKLIIEKNNEEIYSTRVRFTGEDRSKMVSFYLPADSTGMQLYKATLLPFSGEVDIKNNVDNFGVEILNEQTEVAVVYSVLHPDLGMIKRSIETNKQRKVLLFHIDDFKEIDQNKYSVFILYEPNQKFDKLLNYIELEELNYMLVAGSNTDWDFLNKNQKAFSKTISGVSENYFASFQNDFNAFYVEDIGFESFPPLTGQLGNIVFKGNHQVLINQQINDISTNIPLIAAFGDNERKGIAIFGIDIWKWRAQSYEQNDSFERFDNFFNSLIQFLQLSSREKNMDLYYQPVYHAQETIKIQVKNYDRNLNIELNSKLVLQLDEGTTEIPFYVKNNFYEAQIRSISNGKHKFQVKDLSSNKVKRGSFIVESFSLEQESSRPNIEDLNMLAQNSGGELFYPDQFDEVKRLLLDDAKFRATQTQHNKMISLIDWRWLLGLIVLSLSLEWLLRKYRGLI